MLVDVFRAIQASPRLKGVQQEYGGLQGLGEDASPRILWLPRAEQPVNDPRVPSPRHVNVDGQPVEILCYGLVERTVDLVVTVPATADLSCYEKLEALLNEVYVALKEALKSWANYSVGSSPWLDRDEIGKASIGVALRLSVRIPIYDKLATAQAQGADYVRS